MGKVNRGRDQYASLLLFYHSTYMVCRVGVWGNVYDSLRVFANVIYYILGIGLHAYRGPLFAYSSSLGVVARGSRSNVYMQVFPLHPTTSAFYVYRTLIYSTCEAAASPARDGSRSPRRGQAAYPFYICFYVVRHS